jgi:hypothetical protein
MKRLLKGRSNREDAWLPREEVHPVNPPIQWTLRCQVALISADEERRPGSAVRGFHFDQALLAPWAK